MAEATQSTPELLPCPNPWRHSCGVPLSAFSARTQRWHVACACGVRSSSAETEAEAIAAWNTRSTPDRNAVLASLYKEAWDELRRYIYDRTPERREKIIQRFQEKIAALTTTPGPAAADRNAGLAIAAKVADTRAHSAPSRATRNFGHKLAGAIRALMTTTPEPTDPAGVSEMAERLEQAIADCEDGAFASQFGCSGDDRAAVYAVAREAVAALRTPSPVLEVAKEALTEARLYIAAPIIAVQDDVLSIVDAALQAINERSNHA